MNDTQRERLNGGDRDRWTNWHASMMRGDDVTAISFGMNKYGDGPQGDIVRDKGGIDIDDAFLICQAPRMLKALAKLVDIAPDSVEYGDWPELQEAVDEARAVIDATDRTKSRYNIP